MSRDTTKLAAAHQEEVALLLAQDPAAPSHVLAQLSKSQDPEVLRALAKNPNTPQDLLFIVGLTYTTELIENPILPLWFLEQPDLFQRMPMSLLQQMLRHPLPQEWLLQIAEHSSPNVLLSLSYVNDVSSQILARLAQSGSYEVALRAAKHPNTPPAALGWLLTNAEPRVRTAALQNPNTPRALYQLLVRLCKDPDLKETSPVNTALSPEEFEQLASLDYFARALVAQHPELPMSLLARLAQDEADLIRRVVTQHPRLSEELIDLLSQDANPQVKEQLCQRRDLHRAALARLSRDRRESVRLAYLTSEHSTREELLSSLAPLAALTTLWMIPHQTIEKLFIDIKNEHEWSTIAENLPGLRRFLLFHPGAPLSLWRRFAETDVVCSTADSILRERALPEEVLWVLFENKTQEAQLLLTRSKNCPAEILAQLTSEKSATIRGAVASHSNTPPEALRTLSKTPEAAVRRSVARNPSLPIECLASLTQDKDQQVKRAALLALNRRNTLL